jgi:hypothetical protein
LGLRAGGNTAAAGGSACCSFAQHLQPSNLPSRQPTPTTAPPPPQGSYINKVIPAWIAQLLLALLLTVLAWRVSNRALFIYKKESAHKKAAAAQAAAASKSGAIAAAAAAQQQGGGAKRQRRTWAGKTVEANTAETRGRRSAPPRPAPAAASNDVDATLNGGAVALIKPAAGGGAAKGADAADAGATANASSNGSVHSSGSSSWSGGGGPLDGPMCWEPSRLPTLEAQMALVGWRDSEGSGSDVDEGAASSRRQRRQQQQLEKERQRRRLSQEAGRGAAAVPAGPTGAERGGVEGNNDDDAAPLTVAEAKLAYAPAQKRPVPAESPDLGGGTVGGLPVSAPWGGVEVPAPEMAADALADALGRVRAAEAVQLPPWHVAALLSMCGVLLLTSLFSKKMPCGSGGFWGIQAAAIPVLLGMSVLARWDVLRKARVKKAAQVMTGWGRERGGGRGGGGSLDLSWLCARWRACLVPKGTKMRPRARGARLPPPLAPPSPLPAPCRRSPARPPLPACWQIDWTHEFKWSRRNTILFPLICVAAGVVAVCCRGGGWGAPALPPRHQAKPISARAPGPRLPSASMFPSLPQLCTLA